MPISALKGPSRQMQHTPHRWSQLFIPTLREAPADAEVASHRLLLRGGYIRQLGAGIYSYLPLGQRAINKIVAIVREEMDTIGQEFLLPTIHPREIWEASGRWAGMGDNMFRLKDRKGADLCLGMTHEEVMTDIARNELRSYKQLPQIWYQIQTKFRDEPRPKSGLLRVRQFLMKDAYSFDIDEAGLDASYDKHDAVYRRIFNRCGLEFVAVEADSGSMGGSQSQEFMVYTDAGEDLIASCPNCHYAANLEKATSQLKIVEELAPTRNGDPELIHTPGMGAISDIVAFLGISAAHDIKCVALMGQLIDYKEVREKPIIVFLRGDHQVNETKLKAVAIADVLRPMTPQELDHYFKGPAGFLGPVGLVPVGKEALKLSQGYYAGYYEAHEYESAKEAYPGLASTIDNPRAATVIVDSSLMTRRNLVCGANILDYHLRNVTPGRDFNWTLTADIRSINEGEGCPVCGTPLKLGKAVEIGHIFKLGYKYSKAMGASVLNKDGKEVTPIMGSYGIGIERILTAAIEQSAAASVASGSGESYALPATIAPFQVVVTVTNVKEAALLAAGEEIASALSSAGFDVLLDDRDERAGVKFKDAEMIGVPYRINIGKKLADGQVELVDRLRSKTHDIAVGETSETLKQLFAPAL
jgi:prolyl-tRNA synthetase